MLESSKSGISFHFYMRKNNIWAAHLKIENNFLVIQLFFSYRTRSNKSENVGLVTFKNHLLVLPKRFSFQRFDNGSSRPKEMKGN